MAFTTAFRRRPSAYLNEFTFRFNRRFFLLKAFSGQELVFVLNMGQPVKIVELAERMIRLSSSLLGIAATTEPTTYGALHKAGHRPKLEASNGTNRISLNELAFRPTSPAFTAVRRKAGSRMCCTATGRPPHSSMRYAVIA